MADAEQVVAKCREAWGRVEGKCRHNPMPCFSPGFVCKGNRHFRVKLNAVINFILRASPAEESTIWVALASETNHGPKDTPQVLLGKDWAESELPLGKSRGRWAVS